MSSANRSNVGRVSRIPGVTDDIIQHGKSTLLYLQYRGYFSDTNQAAGLLQDKEAEFAAFRSFHSQLIAKTVPSTTAAPNFGATSSKIITNDKRRKEARHKK